MVGGKRNSRGRASQRDADPEGGELPHHVERELATACPGIAEWMRRGARMFTMRSSLAALLVQCCAAPLGACGNAGNASCGAPSSPHTEVWVADQRTGHVEAELADGCSFQDAVTNYRIVGKRPGGRYQLLFQGSLEHWAHRHGVFPRTDGTAEIAVWDRACAPEGDGFRCTQIDPIARWHE